MRLDGGKNYFNVLVDGQQATVLRTSRGIRDYRLDLPDMAAAKYMIKIQKRTENKIGNALEASFGNFTGPVVFYGVVIPETSQISEHPAAARITRRLEFLGDSETSGFGNLGPSQPGLPGLRQFLAMSARHQDANQAWPCLVAKALEAEYHNISWSGIGVAWNCQCAAGAPFPEVYPRLLGCRPESGSISSSDTWMPDAVLVYLGGNDWYSLEGRHDELALGFREFLVQLRRLRPDSVIFVLLAPGNHVCACISSLAEQVLFSDDMSRCWRAAVDGLHDPKLFVEVVNPSPAADLNDPSDWGQCGHWSTNGNAKWASGVIPILAERMKWPVH